MSAVAQAECVSDGGLTVCYSARGIVQRRVMHCPTCKSRRRFTQTWLGAWYGSRLTCCGCGDSWTDGERYPRPFLRGWRKEATDRARRDWQDALTPDEYMRLIREDIAAQFTT